MVHVYCNLSFCIGDFQSTCSISLPAMDISDDENILAGRVRDRSEPYPAVRSSPKASWSSHDSNVACAAASMGSVSLKLPWETGIAGQVFSHKPLFPLPIIGDNPMTIGKPDFLMGMASTTTSMQAAPLLPKIPGHVRKLKLMSWLPEEDDLKARALAMVRTIIESDLSATQLGGLVHDLAHDLSSESQIQRTLNDTFAKKKPATLYKRTRAYWRFFQWLGKNRYHEGLNLTESLLYQYACHLKDTSAAPTTGKSFLESLNFFGGLLGFRAFKLTDVVSARVRGVIHTMQISKAPLKQARPLTVKEVQALEELTVDPAVPTLSVMAGFFMFLIMNCCRFSDAQWAERMDLDSSGAEFVLQSGTQKHKTATTADKLTTILPLVCLGHGFLKTSWAGSWLMLLQSMGWDDTRNYLLPAYSEQKGGWLDRRMTSGEASLWLIECLAHQGLEVLDSHPKLPSTHSCKTTILSWMAKSGGFSISERQIMGHHLDKPSVSALTYGRQNFIPILVKIRKMMDRIVAKTFLPDAKPSLMISKMLQEEELRSQELFKSMGMQLREEVDSDSASEVADMEDLEHETQGLIPAEERRLVTVREPHRFEQHRLSGTLHYIQDDGRFACGRIRGANYLEPMTETVHDAPVCEQCRKAKAAMAALAP